MISITDKFSFVVVHQSVQFNASVKNSAQCRRPTKRKSLRLFLYVDTTEHASDIFFRLQPNAQRVYVCSKIECQQYIAKASKICLYTIYNGNKC